LISRNAGRPSPPFDRPPTAGGAICWLERAWYGMWLIRGLTAEFALTVAIIVVALALLGVVPAPAGVVASAPIGWRYLRRLLEG
jgi:hypothetical protein